MTLQGNLENIIEQLELAQDTLYDILVAAKDKTTNDFFNVNNKTLIELCAMAKNIDAEIKSEAVIPTPPSNITSTDIYSVHVNILNKIQYCNNLLRYALKIYDIDFNDSNKLHELIDYLNSIQRHTYIQITNINTVRKFNTNPPTYRQLDNHNLILKKGDYKRHFLKIQFNDSDFYSGVDSTNIEADEETYIYSQVRKASGDLQSDNLIMTYEEIPDNDIYAHSLKSNNIVQKHDTLNLDVHVTDKALNNLDNIVVDFYEDLDTIESPAYILAETTNNILSYADQETTTITATVFDSNYIPLSEQSVVFKNNSTVLDTVITDSNGVAEYQYSSQGIGDIVITAECEGISENIEIEDCQYYNDGSSVGSLEVGSNVSCTSNGEYITITTSSSGEKDIKIPIVLSGNWELETTVAAKGVTQDATFKIGTGTQWGAIIIDDNIFAMDLGNAMSYSDKNLHQYQVSPQVNDIFKIIYVDGVLSVFLNDKCLQSMVCNISGGKIGYYTNSGRIQHLKNIKFKQLKTMNLSTNKYALSNETSTSCTLSATLLNIDNIDNKVIEFLDGSGNIITSVTDANGVATKEYSPSTTEHTGYVFARYKDMIGICQVFFAKKIFTNQQINAQQTAFDGAQTSFIPYNVQIGDKVHFVFHSKPSQALFGIGTSQASGLVIQVVPGQTKIHRNYSSSTSTYNGNILDTYSVITLRPEMDSGSYSTSYYLTHVFRDYIYWDCWRSYINSDTKGIRVDKFENDDYDIDVIIE